MVVLYKKSLRTVIGLVAAGLLLTLNACEDRLAPDPHFLSDSPIYALNDANQLVRFTIRNSKEAQITTITGTNSLIGERIMSVDFRPATGQLYGVSNKSRLFVINATTGECRPLTTNPFTPGITGSVVGIDFNPTFDRIRVISNEGQDFWLNPETGSVVAKNGAVSGIMGSMVSEIAYTNNRAGVSTTTLYDIDPATDRLYTQTLQNSSKLVDVGPLGLDIAGAAGFDIMPDGTGLAAVTFNGSSELHQVNLSTGRLQKLGNLPGTIIGLAIPTEPVAYAVDNLTNLLIFNPLHPLPTAKAITGLQVGEQIDGIDFRPLTGQLYALSSTNRLYTLNAANGLASLISKGTPDLKLSGAITSFSFIPTLDRIRITTKTGQILLVNPVDGALVADTDHPMDVSTLFRIPLHYTLLRTNDSTRVYAMAPTYGSPSGALLPGNPIIRGFTVGLGF